MRSGFLRETAHGSVYFDVGELVNVVLVYREPVLYRSGGEYLIESADGQRTERVHLSVIDSTYGPPAGMPGECPPHCSGDFGIACQSVMILSCGRP